MTDLAYYLCAMNEKVVILDFGSQYTQLIARRIREQHVFCEIQPYDKPIDWSAEVKAVVLSGSPWSVHDNKVLSLNVVSLIRRVPVLGICFGAQLMAHQLGGAVERSNKREYGPASIQVEHPESRLLKDIGSGEKVWMSHGDTIARAPEGAQIIAGTEDIPVAVFEGPAALFGHPFFGLQFHPEVTHSSCGKQIFKDFLFEVVGLKGDWTPEVFIDEAVRKIRAQVGDDNVLIAISGGVDSSVAGVLLHRAIGDRMQGIFVDNGLLRKGEFQEVLDIYHDLGLNVKGVDARTRFWDALAGVVDPEAKRKVIGSMFIDVLQEEAAELSDMKWLAQGTIYPDVIESLSVHGPSATIKSHHNVGGLPDHLHLKLVEPLRTLFKDEVRAVGRALGIPSYILDRHPFPGPGLGIRILGEVTAESVHILQEADDIYMKKLKKTGWYDKIWQAGTILLPVRSVGVMGDERTYDRVIALRAVYSQDGMTAEWSPIPHDILASISSEIINTVRGVNRVVYDISTKPPATIEWE